MHGSSKLWDVGLWSSRWFKLWIDGKLTKKSDAITVQHSGWGSFRQNVQGRFQQHHQCILEMAGWPQFSWWTKITCEGRLYFYWKLFLKMTKNCAKIEKNGINSRLGNAPKIDIISHCALLSSCCKKGGYVIVVISWYLRITFPDYSPMNMASHPNYREGLISSSQKIRSALSIAATSLFILLMQFWKYVLSSLVIL